MKSLTRWVRRSTFVFLQKSFNIIVIVALLLQPVGTVGVYGAFSFSRGVPVATAADTEPVVLDTVVPADVTPPKEPVVVPVEVPKTVEKVVPAEIPAVVPSIGETGASTDIPSDATETTPATGKRCSSCLLRSYTD